MAVCELLSGLFGAARVSRPFSLSFLCSGEGSFQIVKQSKKVPIQQFRNSHATAAGSETYINEISLLWWGPGVWVQQGNTLLVGDKRTDSSLMNYEKQTRDNGYTCQQFLISEQVSALVFVSQMLSKQTVGDEIIGWKSEAWRWVFLSHHDESSSKTCIGLKTDIQEKSRCHVNQLRNNQIPPPIYQ